MREVFEIAPQYAKYIKVDVTGTSAPGGHIFKAIVTELEAYASQPKGWDHLYADRTSASCMPEGSIMLTTTNMSQDFAIDAVGTYVLTGDVDGDGEQEIVTASGTSLYIYSGNGAVENTITLPRESFVTMLEDADNDGILDIGLGGSGVGFSGYIYKSNGTLLQTFVGLHEGTPPILGGQCSCWESLTAKY